MIVLYYGVFQEHTLGYVFTFDGIHNMMGILHASVIRGSSYSWGGGAIEIDEKQMRKATHKDFDDYHCCLPPDFYNYNS